ncbi:choline-sulfatase [Klebsiella pneumoniae]|uniref:Choline-sulfatase n=1 Tax=Klebsiella pneumoniae TaxID=573 RepID=A0A377XCD3_KLEPN|nr:choline-sulfatase [Klebsiella pneumoniae]
MGRPARHALHHAAVCGQSLLVEQNGDVYSCDHFVSAEYKLGNLKQDAMAAMASSPFQQQFREAKGPTLCPLVRAATGRFACHGGCPKHRFTIHDDEAQNYLCSGYLAFFGHITPLYERHAKAFIKLPAARAHYESYPGDSAKYITINGVLKMKEPNKIDRNRADSPQRSGDCRCRSLLQRRETPHKIMPPRKRHGIFLSPAKSLTHCPKATYLLITCDQERYFERYPFPVPGRERLMKTGITFTNHQNTANVCTPSRSVMYTGLHMPHTRMFDNLGFPWMNYDLDPELRTVGHMMRELGYYTAYKGKWHLTREIDQPVAGKSVEEMDLGEIPTPRLHEIMEKYGFSDYHGIGDVIGKSKGGYFFDSVTTGQTISWLRNTGRPLNDENKPWFAAVNLVNPHDVMFIDTDEHGEQVQWKGPMDKENHTLLPTQPPHNQIYQQSWPDYPLPANRHQPLDEPGRPAAHKEYQNARAVMEGQFPDEDRRWRKLLDYYFNCIRDNDQHLEAILNELDNLQLTQNTIIVFTADHGELGGSPPDAW